MDNVWFVADDLVEMSLVGRSEKAVLALAEQHPEVVVFYAELTTEGFFAGHLQPLRDKRWEDMYATITTYTVDFDEDTPIEFFKIGMYVWYEGGYYWTEQNLAKDMAKDIEFDILVWLLDEMVKIMDHYLDTGIKEQP
jgi:hypothetical protein